MSGRFNEVLTQNEHLVYGSAKVLILHPPLYEFFNEKTWRFLRNTEL